MSKILQNLQDLLRAINMGDAIEKAKIAILLPNKRLFKDLKERLQDENLTVKGEEVIVDVDPISEDTGIIGLISAAFETWSDPSTKRILDLYDLDMTYVESDIDSGKGVFRKNCRELLGSFKKRLGKQAENWDVSDWESVSTLALNELIDACEKGIIQDQVVLALSDERRNPNEVIEKLLILLRGYNLPSDHPTPDWYSRLEEFISSGEKTASEIRKQLKDITFSPGVDTHVTEAGEDRPVVTVSTVARHRDRIKAYDYVLVKLNKSRRNVLPKVRTSVLQGALESKVRQTGSPLLEELLISHREENKSKVALRRSNCERRTLRVASEVCDRSVPVVFKNAPQSARTSHSSRVS